VWVAPSWNLWGLLSVALNSSTLNVEGQRPSVASTSDGRLRSLELESLAVPDVPTSRFCVVVKLVDHRLVGVDELVDDL
jgi:hypothetical protein